MTHLQKDVAANRFERDAAYMVARIGQMPAIVERTDLIASVPRRFAEEIAENFDIEIYQHPIPVAEQHIYMMWHRKNEHDAGHRWLREMLLATMREEPGGFARYTVRAARRPGARRRCK